MAKRVAQLLSLLLVKSVTGENGTASARSLLSARGTTLDVKKDFGAVGDGKKDDTEPIRRAFNALKGQHGQLKFPKGNYLCGPIRFSGLTDSKIQFDKGAELTILDRKEFRKYPEGGRLWIKGEDSNGLEWAGGRFNGNGKGWPFKKGDDEDRPNMMLFSNMQDFEIHDIDVEDAQVGIFAVKYSKFVNIHHVTMKTDSTTNTAGISLQGTVDSTVSYAEVHSGDDCIHLTKKVSNVTFEHLTLSNCHGLSLGGEYGDEELENITFSDLDMNNTHNGLHIKITPETQGFIKDIHVENVRMTNVNIPLHIQTDYADVKNLEKKCFEFGDLYFSDITAKYDGGHHPQPEKPETKGAGAASVFLCDDSAPCNKLHLKDINIETDDGWWFCDHADGEMENVQPKSHAECKISRRRGYPSDDTRRRRSSCSPGPSPGPSPSDSRRRRSSCSLEKQTSHSSCKEGDTFGCEKGHVWTSGGCRGRFTCDDISGIECDVTDTDYVECPCIDSRRRRRRGSEQKREWDLEWNSEDDETQEEFTV